MRHINKRQKKKRRMKFIAMNNYPYEPFSEYQCPYCGWDSESIIGDYEAYENGMVQISDIHYFFDGSYSGREWKETYKCPVCRTMFEFYTSDI